MSETITLEFKKEKLENISYHISDLLCYLNGFKVGISLNKDPFDSNPFDFINSAFEDLRELNIKIKDELLDAENRENKQSYFVPGNTICVPCNGEKS